MQANGILGCWWASFLPLWRACLRTRLKDGCRTERRKGEKENVFLTSRPGLRIQPAIPEAGTSSGRVLGANTPPPLLKPVVPGFLFLANRVIFCAPTQHSDAPPPHLQGLSERPGYWGWPAIAAPVSAPHPPDLGRKQTPSPWLWGLRERSV